MNEVQLSLEGLPAILSDELVKTAQHFTERCPDFVSLIQEQLCVPDFSRHLSRVWACSQFSATLCLRKPEFLQSLIESGDLYRQYEPGAIRKRLQHRLEGVENAESLNCGLRENRQREMLRIIWRDINRIADFQETVTDISALADASIQLAMDFHHKKLCEEVGVPIARVDGEEYEQRMLVLGMGKLGAGELNLSSDIDLIFAYPEGGETRGGKKTLDNSQFFTRLGRRLIQSLDQQTEDGFVFRVDMRLRPYGESGSLVLSFSALEEYYQAQGREWERYAMIKARVVAGDQAQAQQLMDLLRPFTYRRYIDFSAIDSLRSMKLMIQQEVKRRGLHNDVKLGSGGIREIEFIAQSLQLIRGGRDTDLQRRELLLILEKLAAKSYLPVTVAEELTEAYIFLRNTEHGIQAFNDQQTQALPDAAYPQAALYCAMGFSDWESFEETLSRHRENVSHNFREIISDPEAGEKNVAVDECWRSLWENPEDEDFCKNTLRAAGYEDADIAYQKLLQLSGSQIVKRMEVVSRQRLDVFMPLLLQSVTEANSPCQTLLRIIPLVESVLRRTAYLLLLVENTSALKELVVLCAASPWISTQLSRHPVLLDELLNASSLYTTPEKSELHDELKQQILRLNNDDLEGHMEALRYFKQAHVLRVAACEVSGRLPLMKVSDYLTWIAEVILSHVLELAWHNLVEKHGRPLREDGEPCEGDFIVLGYGKVGGIEMGYSSDLDLVFIHDAGMNRETDGGRPVDTNVFFTRLGQRMIHILTTRTRLGDLYEVDMRLRPSGNSGMLVSSLKAFTDYQYKTAWPWEHQALVRARVVAGDTKLAARFEQVRREVLGQVRDEATLRVDVRDMRNKMRDHLLPAELESGEKPIFHLKHGTGGIVDIEFMVQYAVLAWSHQYPELSVYTDNVRILDALNSEGLWEESEVLALAESYKDFRSETHRLSLQQLPVQLPLAQFERQRQVVIKKWQNLMGEQGAQ